VALRPSPLILFLLLFRPLSLLLVLLMLMHQVAGRKDLKSSKYDHGDVEKGFQAEE
jgi:hypothetical protein